eukprot:m.106804 g.106804  ORF g.106804 m.106804 type:complete len:336 (+) comp13309_c0_seq5:71-1078(+)
MWKQIALHMTRVAVRSQHWSHNTATVVKASQPTVAFHKSLRLLSKLKGDQAEVEVVQQELANNPYLDKYKSKIERQLQENVQVNEENKKVLPLKREDTPDLGVSWKKQDESAHAQEDEAQGEASQIPSGNFEAPGSEQDEEPVEGLVPSQLPSYVPALNTIIQVNKVAKLSADEIQQVWTQHLVENNRIAACIPTDIYHALHRRGQACPYFIYVLPRGDGYQLYFGQHSGNLMAFTSLAQYQLHGNDAPPELTLYYYTEYQDLKDIVLMLGEPDTDALTPPEAQLLVHQVQYYYNNQRDDSKFDIVKRFNSGDKSFDFQDVVTEFKQLIEGATQQ